MDPLTGATAFATIVGLIGNFRTERAAGDLPEFIAWLKDKRYEDLADRMAADDKLVGQIAVLLSINRDELIRKLEKLDVALASVAANVEGFGALARVIYPQAELSPQALSVLRQLISSGAKLFMEKKLSGEPNEYFLLEGAHGTIAYEEPRFIEDDLETLVNLGLLRLEFGSRGSRRFFITREALKYNAPSV